MPFLQRHGSDDTVLRILKFFWSMCEKSIEDRGDANGALHRAGVIPNRLILGGVLVCQHLSAYLDGLCVARSQNLVFLRDFF